MPTTQIVYDLVLPELLVNYARAYNNEVLRNQPTLEQFVPDRPLADLEYRIRKGQVVDVDTAEFRAWDTPAPMTGRAGVSMIRGELPPVSRQIPLGEEEFLRLRALEAGNNDPIISQIYDDVELMVRSVVMRMERARGELLSTGKVSINENGLQIEADFGLASDHKPTAALTWANPAATILTDLLTWTQKYVDDTGTGPGTFLMSRQRVSNMFLNNEMRAAAAALGVIPSRIDRATVNAILDANELPPISTYDVKARVNGSQVDIWPTDKVALIPAAGEPFANTFYGVTAEALKLRGKGLIARESMPGIVALVTETDHPVQTYTVATAIALPVLPNPELLLVADVVP